MKSFKNSVKLGIVAFGLQAATVHGQTLNEAAPDHFHELLGKLDPHKKSGQVGIWQPIGKSKKLIAMFRAAYEKSDVDAVVQGEKLKIAELTIYGQNREAIVNVLVQNKDESDYSVEHIQRRIISTMAGNQSKNVIKSAVEIARDKAALPGFSAAVEDIYKNNRESSTWILKLK